MIPQPQHYPYSGMIPNIVLANRPISRRQDRELLPVALQVVCDKCRVSLVELNGKCRVRRIVEARQVLCYVLKQKTNMTLKEIGGCVGGRDHTTVIHSIATARDLMQTDPNFLQLVREVQQQL